MLLAFSPFANRISGSHAQTDGKLEDSGAIYTPPLVPSLLAIFVC